MNTYKTIYCHGWSSGPSVWKPLSEQSSVVSPTYRSVTSSDGFLPALEEVIPSAPHIVVGWSLGGMVALEYAANQHANLKGLVLIGATPRFTAPDRAKGWPAKVIRQMISRLKEDTEGVLKEFQSGMFSPSERRAFKAYRSTFTGMDSIDFNTESLVAGLNYLIKKDLTDVIDAVTCPTLWIHGTEDAICPSGCLEGLPVSHRVAMIDGAGHVPHWSRPDEVRAVIGEFADGL